MSKETIPQSIIDKINNEYPKRKSDRPCATSDNEMAQELREAAEFGFGLSGKRLKKLEQDNLEWEQSFEIYHNAVKRGTEKYRVIHPDFPELSLPDTGKMIESLCNRIEELEQALNNKAQKAVDWIEDYKKWEIENCDTGDYVGIYHLNQIHESVVLPLLNRCGRIKEPEAIVARCYQYLKENHSEHI